MTDVTPKNRHNGLARTVSPDLRVPPRQPAAAETTATDHVTAQALRAVALCRHVAERAARAANRPWPGRPPAG